MKIVFLNTLNAQLTEPLTKFLQTHLADTDAFCLQECYDRMQALIGELFADYTKVEAQKPQFFPKESFRNVILVRKDWTIDASSVNTETPRTGLTLCATLAQNGKTVQLANMHGITRPGKLDTPERIEQSQEVLDMFEPLQGVKIVGGDLNILPETQSIQMFRDAGYQDLIKDFTIKTTRNRIAWDKHPGNELYHSDYVFVQNAKVASFEVPGEIVSDHQPMILTVNI